LLGLIVNASICASIMLASLGFIIAMRGSEDAGAQSKPTLYSFKLFWLLVGLLYFFEFVRIIAVYNGNFEIDKLIFEMSIIPFSLMSVPLVYFVVYLVRGSKTASTIFSSVLCVFGLYFSALVFLTPIKSPTLTYWSSMYDISDLFFPLYISVLYIVPILLIIGLLVVIIKRPIPKKIKYRITLSLVAISLVLDFSLVDKITQIPELQVASRIFVLIGVVFAFLAYFPPMSIKERLEPPLHYEYEEEVDEDRN